MFAIFGVLIVFGAVLGGYLMEKGHLAVLLQPSELLIIGGSGLGTLLIANPTHILKGILSGVKGALMPVKLDRGRYLDTLRMVYELLAKVRKEGMVSVENDIETPAESELFKRYPAFLSDHAAVNFVCDTMRMILTGEVEAFDMDQMMELDTEVHHHETLQPVSALSTMADSLPGLGIVAAVMGVVITMGSLGGPPEEVGSKVASALVGTFLGILLCYGLVGPIGNRMSRIAEDENAYLHVLRVMLTASLRGLAPMIAIEMGRRAIPERLRPTFTEMENICRNQGRSADSQEAA